MNKLLLIPIFFITKSYSQDPNISWDKVSTEIFIALAQADTNIILKYTATIDDAKRARELTCDTVIERKKYINKNLNKIVKDNREHNISRTLDFNKMTIKESGVDLREIKNISHATKYKKIDQTGDCFHDSYELIISFIYLNTPYKIRIPKVVHSDKKLFINSNIIWDK